MKGIFLPTIQAMKEEGCPFRGCLYFGLMVTEGGTKVIEYNSRFGDPETQVVLPLMKSDLLSAMMATRNGTLKECNVEFSSEAACCVVVASKGYPVFAEKGKAITVGKDEEVRLFIAGAQKKDGCLVTSGGRVADVVAVAPTLREAVGKAYRHISVVSFDGMFHRSDIGKKALEAK
jgi:phosphoribosylamine--glycine ligase